MDLAILCCRLLGLDLKELLESVDLSSDSISSVPTKTHNCLCRAVDVPPVDSDALRPAALIHHSPEYETFLAEVESLAAPMSSPDLQYYADVRLRSIYATLPEHMKYRYKQRLFYSNF